MTYFSANEFKSAAIITIDHTSPAWTSANMRWNLFQAKMPTAQLVTYQGVDFNGVQTWLVASESDIFSTHKVSVYPNGQMACWCKWGTQPGTPKGYCLHLAGVWQVVQQEINEADQARLEAIAERANEQALYNQGLPFEQADLLENAALAEYEMMLQSGEVSLPCDHDTFVSSCPTCMAKVEAIWQAAATANQPEEAQAPGYQVTYYGGTTWVNAFEQSDPELFTLDQASGLIATDQPSEIWLHQVATGLTFHLLAVGEGMYADTGAIKGGLVDWVNTAKMFLAWAGQHDTASFADFSKQADLVAAARSDLFG